MDSGCEDWRQWLRDFIRLDKSLLTFVIIPLMEDFLNRLEGTAEKSSSERVRVRDV